MSRRATLNELMGSTAGQGKKDLGLDDLEGLLGERMPEMEYSPRGRLRLITALRNRFGDNYRNLKGMGKILDDFDKEAGFQVKLQEMKMLKGKK